MRGRQVIKRDIPPDQKFQSTVIAKLINMIMRRGKKTVASEIVYSALDNVSHKTKQDPLEVFESAMRNICPVIEVRTRRIGGSNYQVPVEVRPSRRLTLGLRWLVASANGRKGESMDKRLAKEIIDASLGQGAAVKKKEDVQKMAEANRAFAHFA